jgi:hypothetical protein
LSWSAKAAALARPAAESADTDDAPVPLAVEVQAAIDVQRLVDPVEVADADVGDAGRDQGAVVTGAADRGE